MGPVADRVIEEELPSSEEDCSEDNQAEEVLSEEEENPDRALADEAFRVAMDDDATDEDLENLSLRILENARRNTRMIFSED